MFSTKVLVFLIISASGLQLASSSFIFGRSRRDVADVETTTVAAAEASTEAPAASTDTTTAATPADDAPEAKAADTASTEAPKDGETTSAPAADASTEAPGASTEAPATTAAPADDASTTEKPASEPSIELPKIPGISLPTAEPELIHIPAEMIVKEIVESIVNGDGLAPAWIDSEVSP